MRFCHSTKSQTLAILALMGLGLAGCSSESMDRLGGAGGSNYSAKKQVASVAPVEDYRVSSTELPGNTNSFQSRTNFRAVEPQPTPITQSYESAPAPVPAPKQRVVQAPAPAPVPAPAPQPVQQAANLHKVQPGETLYSLGRTYQVKPAMIADANGLDRNAYLKIGQTVKIPGGNMTETSASMADAGPTNITPQPKVQAPKQLASTNPNGTITDESPKTTPNSVITADAVPGFRWPVKGRVISNFGNKPGGQRNEGINISVPEGTSVRAAEAGVVAYAGNELKGYGNLILIRHSNGYVTAYAHNKDLLVKRGDTVKRGDEIAKAGQTGSVTSPQLHFEVRKGATALDPVKFLTSDSASN